MPYFLDGNNLIGQERRSARPSPRDRAALISEIADRLRNTRARVTLFFDGSGERGAALGPLTIHPSGGGSADDAIAEAIRRSPAPQEIIVVTADRGLSMRARDLGAKTSSPREFWNRVGPARPDADRKNDQRPVDVDEWMRYFQDPENRDED